MEKINLNLFVTLSDIQCFSFQSLAYLVVHIVYSLSLPFRNVLVSDGYDRCSQVLANRLQQKYDIRNFRWKIFFCRPKTKNLLALAQPLFHVSVQQFSEGCDYRTKVLYRHLE